MSANTETSPLRHVTSCCAVEMRIGAAINTDSLSASFAGVDVTIASDMRYHYQKKSLDLLTAGENAKYADKVHIFELAREGYEVGRNFSESWLYTHAKNYFVDDEFMLVGSHGIERTGFTNDIELSIGVAEGGGEAGPNTVVGELRRRIWAEFLRIDEDDELLVDPMDGIKELVSQGKDGVENRIRTYYPEKGNDGYLNEAVYAVYEPDGRCQAEVGGFTEEYFDLIAKLKNKSERDLKGL